MQRTQALGRLRQIESATRAVKAKKVLVENATGFLSREEPFPCRSALRLEGIFVRGSASVSSVLIYLLAGGCQRKWTVEESIVSVCRVLDFGLGLWSLVVSSEVALP
jgi:hypothetical protein